TGTGAGADVVAVVGMKKGGDSKKTVKRAKRRLAATEKHAKDALKQGIPRAIDVQPVADHAAATHDRLAVIQRGTRDDPAWLPHARDSARGGCARARAEQAARGGRRGYAGGDHRSAVGGGSAAGGGAGHAGSRFARA